jgi:uncharacterized membrane protein YjjP (DUF1212 family)
MPGMFLNQGAYHRSSGKESVLEVESSLTYDTILRLGLLLQSRGAATVDVESAVHGLAVALGLRDVEVDVIYNSITLSSTVDNRPAAAVRVVRIASPDYSRLTDAHRLVSDIIDGRVDLRDARARLLAIEASPRRHSKKVNAVAAGGLAAAVALSLGSGWVAAFIVLITSTVIQLLGRWLYRTGLPPLFTYATSGLIAALVGAATIELPLSVRPSLLIAAGIVAMLPGSLLVAAVSDSLNGYPLTAGARFMEVAVVIGGIVVGVVAGLGMADRLLGIEFGLIPGGETSSLSLLLRALSAAAAAAAAAIMVYSRPFTSLWVSGIACIGFLVSFSLRPLGSDIAETFLASIVIGLLGSVVARRLNTLPLVVVVPAIVPLLPGIAIYSAALLLAQGQAQEGIIAMLSAVTHAAALASGVLVGEFVDRVVRGERRTLRSDTSR